MTTVKEIADEVRGVGSRLDQLFKGNNWVTSTPIVTSLGGHAPATSVDTVVHLCENIADRIQRLTKSELSKGGLDKFLGSLPTQLQSTNFQNLSADPDAIANGAVSLLFTVWSQLPPEPQPQPDVDWEKIKDKDILPKDLARRLRSVEAKLKDLEPRSALIEEKIELIESAHIAAEQLPTDMQDLTEKRNALGQAVADAQELGDKIGEVSDRATGFLSKIEDAQARADGCLLYTSPSPRDS